MKQFFDIALPKWPRLLVKGDDITKEQAGEIIIRTSSLPLSGNDNEFIRQIHKRLFGYNRLNHEIYCEKDEIMRREMINHNNNVLEQLKILDVVELYNSRVVSAWISGPHGWCNWSGKIYTDNYNIGKWPEVETVYEDWVKIAEAFPFLNLKSQIVYSENDDYSTNAIELFIEFDVKNGKVTMSIPTNALIQPKDYSTEQLTGIWMNKYRERGCTFEQFDEALTLLENKMK